jgi:hypothetical protein
MGRDDGSRLSEGAVAPSAALLHCSGDLGRVTFDPLAIATAEGA